MLRVLEGATPSLICLSVVTASVVVVSLFVVSCDVNGAVVVIVSG